MEIERRIYDSEMEVRALENSKVQVRGYAAVFNSLSQNLGGFREQIAPGAFDPVLDNDVRALFNHDQNLILGRTRSGTLRLGVDSKGLEYEYNSPDTSYARDLLVSLERGDVTQSSFGFTVRADDWTEEDGVVRTVTQLGSLFDVSPVTFPAYPDTQVAKRSLLAWREAHDGFHTAIQRRQALFERLRGIR